MFSKKAFISIAGKRPTIESSQTSYVIGRDSVILTCLTEPDGLSGAAYQWKLDSNTVYVSLYL